ncbi:MAG: hypothetical protein ACI9CO_002179, partial [Candidatus Azotimanducaceae bacterium]
HCQTISTFAPSLQIITLYLGSALIKAMKVNVILRTLLFLTFLGCNTAPDTEKNMLLDEVSFDLPELNDFYFPSKMEKGKEEIDDKLDSFQNQWYSDHLFSLKEPILFEQKGMFEGYRYTNLGSFDNPYTFRVIRSASTISIIKKKTDGHGGFGAGKLILNETKEISEQEWENLINEIAGINFWELPTHTERHGSDGGEWILEGYKNGKYHFLTRWSPNHNRDKKFVEACAYFEKIFSQ